MAVKLAEVPLQIDMDEAVRLGFADTTMVRVILAVEVPFTPSILIVKVPGEAYETDGLLDVEIAGEAP